MKKSNKIIYLTFVMAMVILISLVSQAYVSNCNIELERLKTQIKVQANKNEKLSIEINELQSFAHLQKTIEEEGLKYDCTKIKFIASNNK